MSISTEKAFAERVSDTIKEVQLEGKVKKLIGVNGEYEGKAVILATGAFPRPIGCKNEGKFVGKGISFSSGNDLTQALDADIARGINTLDVGVFTATRSSSAP